MGLMLRILYFMQVLKGTIHLQHYNSHRQNICLLIDGSVKKQAYGRKHTAFTPMSESTGKNYT